jgi:hypothetical protein
MRLTSTFRHGGLCLEKIKSLPLSQKCVWRTAIDKKKFTEGAIDPKRSPGPKYTLSNPGILRQSI